MTILLAVLTGLGPLTVDMYLASMPDIGRALAASPAQVQLTISSYLIGYAIGQVFYGPLSDRHGRRPVMLAALTVYVLASFACAVAPTIELLIAARFVQAVGGAGAVVLARAVVRDVYEGVRLGRELAVMATIVALAPIAAPLLGGVLQTLFGWRSNFVLLLLFGIGAVGSVWMLMPETLRTRAPEPVSPVSILRSYRSFLGHRAFVAHLAIATAAFLGLFGWISVSAFVLQDIYGQSPLAFGLVFAACSSGYMGGTAIAARVVMHWGSDRTMGVGCAAMAAGGLAMSLALTVGWQLPATLVLGMALFLGGMGMVWPQAQAGALMPFPDRAGAASSLMGVVQQTSSAAIGALLGHLIGATAWPLALGVGGAGVLALAIWAATRTIRRV